MFDLDNFSQAVAGIYDASMDVDRWIDTLSLLARIFDSRGAQISVASALDRISFLKVWGWADEQLAPFMPRYVALTPTDPRAGMLRVPYKPTQCRQFVSDEDFRASEIYKQVLAPVGIEYAMGVFIPIEEKLISVISVIRGPDGAAFTTADCGEFSRLVPHLTRAVSMHGAFRRSQEELANVKALLDSLPLGMMVVDGDEVKVANRAARRLLDEGNAMRIHNGRLHGASQRADADLRDAVHHALSGTDQPVGVVLPLDHAEPIRAVVRRLHAKSARMLGTPSDVVAVYVTDPRKPLETSHEILQRLFGLTAREAAVLQILAEGQDVNAAAARLGVGIATVRSHVKHIKERTGVSRQGELVRLVLSSPAWVVGSENS
ncbi:MAG TPA: LuxR C-terminal-related transcriptional regulator [Lacipirellulaceae bacterium]|nr:LuxR C-terminal-related transcriptional regulator [Lacipirellulaceae bacterium]